VSKEIIARQLSEEDGYDNSLVEHLMLANGVSKSVMVDSITGSIYHDPHPSSDSLNPNPAEKRFETEFDRKACNTKGLELSN
jgi:hypothetical protein